MIRGARPYIASLTLASLALCAATWCAVVAKVNGGVNGLLGKGRKEARFLVEVVTRYVLSTDDDGPNVVFAGSKAELVHFVTSNLLSRPHSRPSSFRRDTDGTGLEPSRFRAACSARPLSLEDRPEDWACKERFASGTLSDEA